MPGLEHVQLHLVQSSEDCVNLLRWLGERRESGVIAVDLETGELPGRPTKDALSAYHGRIRLAQMGDENYGWAIPWDEWAGVFYEAMARFDGRIITHNVAFEGKWLTKQSRWEFPWHRVDDTMIAAAIIDPINPVGLKPLTSRYVDSKAAAMQQMLDMAMAKHGYTWGTVPIALKEYWSYGALDTVLTVHLWQKLRSQVEPGGEFHRAYDIEMATRRICTRMEMNGARVDLEYSAQKYNELNDYAEQVKRWASDTYGKLSIGSNVQLVRWFEKMGVEITEFTAGGSKSCDKNQLKKIVRDYPGEVGSLAKLTLDMRKASKLAGTYFGNILSDHNDGLLHASIRTMGARTGRMSISSPGPALQTLPKSDTVVRKAFIARDPENEVLISSDLDQVEFRMTAALSGDPGLIELFRRCDAENGDAFTEIMREVYNDPTLQKSDPRRKLIKGTVYGKLYGAGVSKMALTSGVTDGQMKGVVDAFDSQYPGVKQFSKQIEDAGSRRLRDEGQAYVKTQTGRKLPCDDDRIYSLTNYAVQGGAAEVFKLDLIKCDAAGLSDYLVVPVHDELVLSVPKNEAKDIMPVLQDSMTTKDGWAVPLTAGISGPADNWGDLSE